MSTADDAWQEWNSEDRLFYDATEFGEAAFMAGYRRALEDAADQSTDTDAMDYWVGILSEERQWAGVADWLRNRAAGVGGNDESD